MILNLGFDCPRIFGDPAILMNEFYSPSVSIGYEAGVILHHKQFFTQDLIRRLEGEGIRLISIIREGEVEIEKFIDEVCSCKKNIYLFFAWFDYCTNLWDTCSMDSIT